MKISTGSTIKIIKRSLHAVIRFPATVACAFFVAFIASLRLEQADSQNMHLLISLQLALLATSAIILALTAALAVRPTIASLANLAALPLLVLLWLLFYTPGKGVDAYALVRAVALTTAALALLPVFYGKRSGSLDFSQALFLLLKSAFTAAVYSLAIMLGLLFITFAFQSLLYQNLAENIYLHIAIWSLFIWLPISLSYLPDLSLAAVDPLVESGSKQPRFIKVLFVYVLIPLFALLALVLLAWSIRIIITGQWPGFALLSFILLAFAGSGSGLALLTSHATELPARLFARLFPPAAVLFLLFAGWATGLELKTAGLQSGSYFVIIFWLFTLASALILLLGRPQSHPLIAYLAAALCLISVMPALNYRTVPVFFQQRDLERALEQNGMLLDGKIRPKAALSTNDKATITRAVDYLLGDDLPKADWLSSSISSLDQFEMVFGFAYSDGLAQPSPDDIYEVGLYLSPSALDIRQADLLAFAANEDLVDFSSAGLDLKTELVRQGAAGYHLLVRENNQVLVEQDLAGWLEDLADRFSHLSLEQQQDAASLADLSLQLETENFQLTFVFNVVYATREPAGPIQGDYLALYCVIYQEN